MSWQLYYYGQIRVWMRVMSAVCGGLHILILTEA